MRLYLRLIVALPLGSSKSSPRRGETFIEANAKTSLFFDSAAARRFTWKYKLTASPRPNQKSLTH